MDAVSAEISTFFNDHACQRSAATHLLVIGGEEKCLKVSDSDEGQAELATHLATIGKTNPAPQLSLCELKTPHFACFITYVMTSRQGYDAVSKTLRKLVKSTSWVMLNKLFTTLPHITANLFLGENTDGKFLAQAVFPEIVVNKDRHAATRRICLEELTNAAPEVLAELNGHSAVNDIGVVMTMMSTDELMPVPFTRCLVDAAQKTLGQTSLRLVGSVTFKYNEAKTDLDVLVRDHKSQGMPSFIQAHCLKRRDARAATSSLTTWSAPEEGEKQKGKSKTKGGGSPQTSGAGTTRSGTSGDSSGGSRGPAGK
jgi:hypothetical protein